MIGRTRDGRYEVTVTSNTWQYGTAKNEVTTNYLWEVRDCHNCLVVVDAGKADLRETAVADAWYALRALRDR